MDIKTIPKIGAILAAVGIWVGTSINAHAALSWTVPLQLSSHDVVGAAESLTGDGQGAPATVNPVMEYLLDLGANYTSPGWQSKDSTRDYATGPTDYKGNLTFVTSGGPDKNAQGQVIATYIPSGYEYVAGKYDGPNAGYILFHLGFQDAYIPATSYAIWGENAGQFDLSGWYAYNPVPEPTTIVAGALLILPFGVSTLRALRNRKA